ncbi:MAG TPA: hypothetical protein VJC37_06900 [Planctomycetota bacterium]|nr:hypothetical protein [Planctomycetota bacterium]
MLLLCKKCAYPNLPTSDVCGRCGNVTQSPTELAQSIQSWNGLPEKVRMEFEQKYRSAQERYTKRPLIQRKRRLKDALLGGSILGVVGLIHGPLIIVDFVVGAVMGLILNMTGGGSFTGTFLFGLGYLISFMLKGFIGFVWGNIITLLFGLVVGICAGYFVGLALDLKRSDDL